MQISKKLFKRMMCMAAATVMALSMGACGKKDENKGNDPETVYITVVNKGYGSEFVKQLIKSYVADTGNKAEILDDTNFSDYTKTTLAGGPAFNKTDLYISIENYFKDILDSGTNYCDGLKKYALADLSDVYSSKAEGYGSDKTYAEIMEERAFDSICYTDRTGFTSQYAVPWATAASSMVYDKAFFDQYGLEVPLTTVEFFELCDRIKTLNNGSYPKNDYGDNIYPYIYCGNVDYSNLGFYAWWGQYEGKKAMDLAIMGQVEEGVYGNGYEIFNQLGRYYALKVFEKLLYQGNGTSSDPSNGYVNPTVCQSASVNFTDLQTMYLDHSAAMMLNGDWLAREMSANFSNEDLTIRYMKLPILSAVVEKLSFWNEAEGVLYDDISESKKKDYDLKLSQIVKYVDAGKTGAKPAFSTDADVAYIEYARSVVYSETFNHICYVPEYSDNVEGAKDFLKYMLSKKGQEIVMKYGMGCTAPLNVDFTSFDAYRGLSDFARSRFSITEGAYFVGKNASYPMMYLGGLILSGGAESLGLITSSKSYRNALEIVNAQYLAAKGNWATYMTKTRVSD